MGKKQNNQKHTINHIRKIDRIRDSKEKITFKDSANYLWSYVGLGVNWMIYEKVLLVLLITLVLVATLVWLPHIGIIFCLLTPVFLGMYGKYLYHKIAIKDCESSDINKPKILIPSSLIIIWGLIIFVGILFIDIIVEAIIF